MLPQNSKQNNTHTVPILNRVAYKLAISTQISIVVVNRLTLELALEQTCQPVEYTDSAL